MIHDAYVAGFLDGEGHVSIIYRPRRSDRKEEMQCYIFVSFTMTTRETLDALSERFGGKVYHWPATDPRWNDRYRWQRSGQSAERVLRAARPYALIKRPHIEICLKHQTFIVQGGRATPERSAKNAEALRRRLELREDLRKINKRGREVSDGAQPDGRDADSSASAATRTR